MAFPEQESSMQRGGGLFPGLVMLSAHVEGYSEGLFATPDMIDRIGTGTTAQFQEDSAVYDDRYFNADGKILTLRRALELTPSVQTEEISSILDIGCGSGNATFALLNMLPDCMVHATDISAEMVSILVSRAKTRGVADRVIAFVSDAETLNLPEGAFDLIVGSSMVHHLLEPDRFLDRAIGALDNGGVAIFTEPMKAGHVIVRHFLDQILHREDLRRDIPDDVIKFFADYSFTIDAMCAMDRSRLDYSKLDDKWMFSRRFFEAAARRNSVTNLFFSVNPIEHRFRDMIERLVWLGLGKVWKLPDAAREMISAFDAAIPADLSDEFAFEACIVFAR
jgi:ubiquinone/menaquinone biosynthesis C-methylase UbiE